jgi:hypothetical protein
MPGDATMQPTRDPRATLPDLIEVLLNKGVHLNLDLIISVADIPLIGINLRATIAGIETMIEYGMMQQWDRDTQGVGAESGPHASAVGRRRGDPRQDGGRALSGQLLSDVAARQRLPHHPASDHPSP